MSSNPAFAAFVALVADAPVVGFVKDLEGRYVFANRHALTTVFAGPKTEWQGKTDPEIWPPDVAARVRQTDDATRAGHSLHVFTQVMPVDDQPHTFLVVKLPIVLEDGRLFLGGIAVDQTDALRTSAERDLLATVVEQVAESVMIADLDTRITYVNPAFERVSGYTRDEVLGKNPRILNSGVQPPAFYESMWAALTNGSPWVADFVNRRKDGSLYTEEAVISPIHDASGALTSYVAVKRDVTREREIENQSMRRGRERALIAETLSGLRPGEAPEATAQAICRQVLNLSGVVAAQLFIFEIDSRAVSIGFALAGQPDPPLRRLPSISSKDLRGRAAQGPWIQPWFARPGDAYFEELKHLGDHLVASAPIRSNNDLIGLLVIDGGPSVDQASLAESLVALVEFADLAGVLISRDVADRTDPGSARAEILDIIGRDAFEPVFQPIVDMRSEVILGYEALTRFTDGVSAEVRFAEATAVGLGLELEMATLQSVWAAAKALPRSAWVSLNVSPALILAGLPLRSLLRGRRRSVVLEVTEHAAIDDYEALRAAISDLGQGTQLAVDDAGAGFSSLRHILELKPAYVKLDRWLVAGLHADTARQAMIVGLQHFARTTGCLLIAEGVESAEELAVLRTMDIELGQGYLFGRPASATIARA
ncbi:MAG: EAL domain-containing protein [Chloroflexota bacterium]|nr:EAL domain-containing protein [Chloroflexota bacterium]